MKKKLFRIASIAIIVQIAFCFGVSAQNFFFDREWEDGKITSKVMYELRYTGLYEKTYKFEYSYDDFDNLLMEDVHKWNSKESVWLPDRRTIHKNNIQDNIVVIEYITWNDKIKQYNEPSEKLIYQLSNFDDRLTYLARYRNSKTEEFINEYAIEYARNAHIIKEF